MNEDLASTLALMIEHALADGLSLPLYLVGVSANGQVFACRYDLGQESLDCTPLCQYVPESNFVLPINVYFSDTTGKATRAVFEVDGQPQWTN